MVHGDLKTDNILVCPASSAEMCPKLKIGDFGTAEVNPPRNIPLGQFGTIGFQAPEVATRYGPESDLWALGCIIYQLATRRLPLLELEEPDMDPEMWFDLNNIPILDGTLAHSLYKLLCHYMAFHPPAPERIDHKSMKYSKLLNYFMMCALDTNYRTRITAYELHRSLPVLKNLAHDIILSGQESILNRFDNGRDADWKLMSIVTDSSVFEQNFYVLALRAHRERSMEFLTIAISLLELMDSTERVSACLYVAELNSLRRY